MTSISSFLTALGLSDKEINLYLAALKYGPQSASTLARKTGIPRSTVNFVANELIQKGLFSKVCKEKDHRFEALDPEFIENLLLEKQARIKKEITDFKEILPALSSFKNKNSTLPRMRYFEGYEGLCRMLDEFCSKDETVLYISGHNMMHPRIRKYVYDVYMPICNQHRNKNKIILNEGVKAHEYKEMAKKAYDEFIFVDSKKYPFTLTTAIYGNKVAFWSYDPQDMSGVILENQLIANNMRTVFKILEEKLV